MRNIDLVPNGWKVLNLRSITDSIQYGYTESASKEKIGPKFLRITDIQDNKVQWNDVPYCKINNEIKGKYLLKDGDLVFARTGATVGKSFLIKGDIPESVFASYLIRVRVNQEINEKYLSYFFHSPNYWSQITEGQVGIGQPNVNGTKLGQIKISIAPIIEQQAIVSKIEELLSDLENGKQQLQLAQQQLKVYRQSLLKWAFEDGLLRKGWKKAQIKYVADTIGGYAFKSGNFLNNGKYQVLRMGNVRPGRIRYNESPVFLNEVDSTVLNRSLLQFNDIIITQTGTRKKRDYGFTALIQKTNLLLNQRIAAIRFKVSYLPKFFLYYSWTDLFKDQFFENETGNVGQGNVGMRSITETLIPFCSINEQQKIVDELESKLTVCDKIEVTISQSLKQAEALRQSILKKAFEGRLV